MASPFPGMDPFLEDSSHWPCFHGSLMTTLYQLLLPPLVDRYRARIGIRNYTSEMVLFTSVRREEHQEEFIEIWSRSSGRLVTLIDVVSIGNKTTTAGRTAYLQTRSKAADSGAAMVEIDLITQGTPTLDYDRSDLPDSDYTVTVTRSGNPNRFEIYANHIVKRLPKFKLPLAADDRDTVLDLQYAFTRAYDQSQVGATINYTGPLPADVRLSDASREWIRSWLNPALG